MLNFSVLKSGSSEAGIDSEKFFTFTPADKFGAVTIPSPSIFVSKPVEDFIKSEILSQYEFAIGERINGNIKNKRYKLAKVEPKTIPSFFAFSLSKRNFISLPHLIYSN